MRKKRTVEQILSDNNLSDDVVSKLIQELANNDRYLWNQFSQSEKIDFLEVLEELVTSGRSIKLDALWEYDYKIKPKTFLECVEDPYYVGEWGASLYDKWKETYSYVLDPANNISEIIISGSIGTGKSTAAMFAIWYKLYRLACLRNPQKFLPLMNSTGIVFGVYSVSLKSAGAPWVLLFDMIDRSPFFKEHCDRDRSYKTKIILPNNVSVMTGSNELHVISQNLLSMILDEANFMKTGKNAKHDDVYGEIGKAYNMYTACKRRVESRFLKDGYCPSLMVIISSKKSDFDFVEKHIEANKNNKNTYICEYSLWDVKPTYYSKDRFTVVLGSRQDPPYIADDKSKIPDNVKTIDVPTDFIEAFKLNIDSALRDIAGISTQGSMPLIRSRDSIDQCFSDNRKHPFKFENVETGLYDNLSLVDLLNIDDISSIKLGKRIPRYYPDVPRTLHIDIGLTGDAYGIAMGCPLKSLQISNDNSAEQAINKHTFIDFILRITAPKGSEVDLEKARTLIYYLRDELGFNIEYATLDGFQSVDTKQCLIKKGINSELHSLDINDTAYIMLRESLTKKRVHSYRYTYAEDELYLLQWDAYRNKVNHLPTFSKDVSDAVCGVNYNCMTYKKFETLTNNIMSTFMDSIKKEEYNIYNDDIPSLELPNLGG